MAGKLGSVCVNSGTLVLRVVCCNGGPFPGTPTPVTWCKKERIVHRIVHSVCTKYNTTKGELVAQLKDQIFSKVFKEIDGTLSLEGLPSRNQPVQFERL